MTFISVQMRPQREKQLMQWLEEVKRGGQHVFPGTVARYVVRSEAIPRQIEPMLIWRSTVMPNEVANRRWKLFGKRWLTCWIGILLSTIMGKY